MDELSKQEKARARIASRVHQRRVDKLANILGGRYDLAEKVWGNVEDIAQDPATAREVVKGLLENSDMHIAGEDCEAIADLLDIEGLYVPWGMERECKVLAGLLIEDIGWRLPDDKGKQLMLIAHVKEKARRCPKPGPGFPRKCFELVVIAAELLCNEGWDQVCPYVPGVKKCLEDQLLFEAENADMIKCNDLPIETIAFGSSFN